MKNQEVKEIIYSKSGKPSKQSLPDSLDFFGELCMSIPEEYRESSFIVTDTHKGQIHTIVGFYRPETDLEAAKRIVKAEKEKKEKDIEEEEEEKKEEELFFSLLNKYVLEGRIDLDVIDLNNAFNEQ